MIDFDKKCGQSLTYLKDWGSTIKRQIDQDIVDFLSSSSLTSRPVWPDVAKFSQFGNLLKPSAFVWGFI